MDNVKKQFVRQQLSQALADPDAAAELVRKILRSIVLLADDGYVPEINQIMITIIDSLRDKDYKLLLEQLLTTYQLLEQTLDLLENNNFTIDDDADSEAEAEEKKAIYHGLVGYKSELRDYLEKVGAKLSNQGK